MARSFTTWETGALSGTSGGTKNRLPPDSPESCGDGYQHGENMYEFWRADGKFSVFWWYRENK
jgi:hypothetical protein